MQQLSFDDLIDGFPTGRIAQPIQPIKEELYEGYDEWLKSTTYFFMNITDRDGKMIKWEDALRISSHLGYKSPVGNWFIRNKGTQ